MPAAGWVLTETTQAFCAEALTASRAAAHHSAGSALLAAHLKLQPRS